MEFWRLSDMPQLLELGKDSFSAEQFHWCYTRNTMVLKRSSHAIYDLHYHFMWATKYRKDVLTPEIQKNIKRICYEIAKHYDFLIEAIEVTEDHLHILIEAPPRYSPAQIAQLLKGRTTSLIFRQFPGLKKHYWGGEIWVGGYCVKSVGEKLNSQNVKNYIKAHKQTQISI